MRLKETLDLDTMSGNIYFMSDIHYNHENAISFGNRPFNNVSSMNKYILDTIKETLKPEDILFTLGDDFWKMKIQDIKTILESFPTKNIHKIMGNHDKYGYYWCGGEIGKLCLSVSDILDIVVRREGKEYKIVLSHYPIYDFNHMYHGGLHLYGHVHGSLDEEFKNNPRLMVDVGFDGALARSLGTFLISFDQILEYFYTKTGGIDFDLWGRKNYKSSVKGYGVDKGETD
jgi:calcineurin-like phosphoesterase family protein